MSDPTKLTGITSGQQFMTLEEASDRLHTPIPTLRQWIREGRLAAFKPGRRVLVRACDLDATVERSRIGGVR